MKREKTFSVCLSQLCPSLEESTVARLAPRLTEPWANTLMVASYSQGQLAAVVRYSADLLICCLLRFGRYHWILAIFYKLQLLMCTAVSLIMVESSVKLSDELLPIFFDIKTALKENNQQNNCVCSSSVLPQFSFSVKNVNVFGLIQVQFIHDLLLLPLWYLDKRSYKEFFDLITNISFSLCSFSLLYTAVSLWQAVVEV